MLKTIDIITPYHMDTFREGPVPFPEVGAHAIRKIYSLNKQVCLCIARNLNGNVMVYKVGLDKDCHITGVDMFWLDLEPSFVEAARKARRSHDRDEPCQIDHMVYGIDIVKRESSTTWQVKFKQFPQLMTIHAFPDRSVSLYRVGKNTHRQKVFSFFIHTRMVLGIPKVDQIDLTAFNTDDKKPVVEVIQP